MRTILAAAALVVFVIVAPVGLSGPTLAAEWPDTRCLGEWVAFVGKRLDSGTQFRRVTVLRLADIARLESFVEHGIHYIVTRDRKADGGNVAYAVSEDVLMAVKRCL